MTHSDPESVRTERLARIDQRAREADHSKLRSNAGLCLALTLELDKLDNVADYLERFADYDYDEGGANEAMRRFNDVNETRATLRRIIDAYREDK